jgi:argininosuccinate lyase
MDNRMFAYEAAPDDLRSAGEAALLIAECVESLHFDNSRALAGLNDRSACATDLVERLMAATGADYRAAHGVVGGLIRALEDKGRSLADATVDDLCAALRDASLPSAGVTEQLLSSALDPAACVAARTDVGGAAPEEVAAMAQALTIAAAERRSEIEAARAHRKAALDRLRAEAECFARDAT